MRSQNLTKLAKSHAGVLFQEEPIIEANGVKGEANTSEDANAVLNAEDVINCVVSAMEDVVGQLITSLELATEAEGPVHGGADGRNSANAAVGTVLKVLRLYWRAFQGHFLHLAAALSSSTVRLINSILVCTLPTYATDGSLCRVSYFMRVQLENCVLATANTASALVYMTAILPSTEQGHGRWLSPKLARDAHSVLELVMSFPTKITSAHEITSPLLPETGLAIVQALLWYPADDMVRAIVERQEQSRSESQQDDRSAKTTRDESTMDVAIRWTHWCLLVAIAAASRPDAVHDRDTDRKPLSDNDVGIVELLDKLLDRYRDDCAIRSSAAMITSVTPLAVDALLELLTRLADFEQLQLALLKHAVHPCADQRHLCWEVWKELICYCWEEDTALAALETLLTLAEQESEDGDTGHAAGDHHQPPTPLPSRVVDDITRFVAFMYSEMPLSLKEACVQRVTAAIEHICSDGPYHAFSPTIAARLSLLDQLSAARFLRDYDHPDKEQWIATQLPMCFECCGTIIELLGGTSAEPDLRSDAGKFTGAMRVLEVCLLLLKSVYDDNDAREDITDLAELSRILLPVMTEVLTLLTKSVRRTQSVGSAGAGIGNGRARQRIGSAPAVATNSIDLSTTRVLRTCLYLLGKMGALIKRNHSNQCVQVMKNLLDLVGNDGAVDRKWEQSTTGAIAWFVKTTLFDVQAAENDMPVVAELLTTLFQRLCASEKAAMKSPLGHVIVEALYGILAYSNVARSLNIQASMPVVSARRDVRQLALLHRDVENDVDSLTRTVAALVSSSDARESRARHATRCHRVFRQWFPSSTDDSMERTDGGVYLSNDDQKIPLAATEKKRKVGGQDGEPSTTITIGNKRQKLAHLVARCRQIIDNCGSTADNVSDQELDRAAKVLEDILAKVLSF